MRYVENRTKNIFHFSRDSLAACEPRQPLAHHETLTCFCSADAYCFVTCATRRRLGATFVQELLVSVFVLLAAARQTTCIDFECVRYAVGITPRPGLVACGDGRGVSADPIRISAAQNCEPILYSEAQRLGGRIGFYDTPAANAASPGRGVMPTERAPH